MYATLGHKLGFEVVNLGLSRPPVLIRDIKCIKDDKLLVLSFHFYA